MNVEIRTIEPIRVAYLRGFGPYQQSFPKLWPQFGKLAAARGLFKPGARTLSIPHDNPDRTPPEQIRGDACVTVDDTFAGDGELQVQTIPAGRYAVVKHVGPYAGLAATWRELADRWIPENGLRIRPAPCFEIYVSDPRNTPESELLTEVYEPVE